MLLIQDLQYKLPNGNTLFNNINFTVSNTGLTALVGENGVGKSTLLKLVSGKLKPALGTITFDEKTRPYFIPQHYGQLNKQKVIEVLGIDKKWNAYQSIMAGSTNEKDYENFDDDWELELKIKNAFSKWSLDHIKPEMEFSRLSGGEKTRVLLSGVEILNPNFIVLDEPSNHLDSEARQQLTDWLLNCKKSILLISHDRQLLEICDKIIELNPNGVQLFNGNFSAFRKQRLAEKQSLIRKINSAEKTKQDLQKKQRSMIERKEKERQRGAKRHLKRGTDKKMVDKLKAKSEGTISSIKGKQQKVNLQHDQKISELKTKEKFDRTIKTDFASSNIIKGKKIISFENVSFHYNAQNPVIKNPLSFKIYTGDRIEINGRNGSGKSTLLKLLTNKLQASSGLVHGKLKGILIDQDYSIIDRKKTVLEQADSFNDQNLKEHEIKIRLSRYLFDRDSWSKKCSVLSGGEILRLSLCCIMISNEATDLILLDEPTNNLDLNNIEVLTNTMAAFTGTIICVSHDSFFKKEIGINKSISL